MSILELPTRTPTEQIEALEKGLPSSALNEVSRAVKLPKATLILALRFAPRTVTQREHTKARFTLVESERLLRVLRLRTILREVFTTDDAVAEWLSSPDRSLGGKNPLALLATDVGAAKVENLARAMVHGVPI